LDFGKGTWILNKSRSNFEIFDAELYTTAKRHFKEILDDSLVEINDLRMTKLIPQKNAFELSKEELMDLRKSMDCDYLINVKGNVINDGAGTLSVLSNDSNYYASNEASCKCP
jgi:hypothetical protein